MTLSFIVRRSVVLFYIVSTAGEIEMILSSAFAFAPPFPSRQMLFLWVHFLKQRKTFSG